MNSIVPCRMRSAPGTWPYQKVHPSRYVPREASETPLAEWKRFDLLQDVLPAHDAAKVQAAGTIGIEEWIDKVKSGDPTA